MGRAALDGTSNEFIEKILALPVKFNEDQVELIALRSDQLRFGWEGPLSLNGKALSLNNFKHYDNSYCACELGAPVMEIRHRRDVLRLHFDVQNLKTDH